MIPLSPLPGLAQTAAKATAGSIAMAVTTLVLYLLARFFGIVEMPDASLVAEAVTSLVLAVVSAAVTWLTVYFTPNKPKDGSTLQSHPVATLFAFGLVLIVFAAFLYGGAPGGVDPDAALPDLTSTAPSSGMSKGLGDVRDRVIGGALHLLPIAGCGLGGRPGDLNLPAGRDCEPGTIGSVVDHAAIGAGHLDRPVRLLSAVRHRRLLV
ncbi:MAG: hypothetical protein ACRC67_27255 [Inquilinus sp.]|uniref:hypothetical protein n=1 Tax=Inquilinus sp. TaxID=1932117 RepID=UPI003F2F1641